MEKKVLLTVLSAIFVVAGCLGLSSCKKNSQALDTPSNIKMENRVLTWDAVENANEYILLINGKEYTVTEPRLELYTIIKEGEFHLKLMAGGDGETYEDSSWATSSFTLEAPVEHGFDEEGFEYTFLEDGSGYEVAKGTANLEGFVSIPDYFDGYPVVRIAYKGFSPDIPGDAIASDVIMDTQCNHITTGIKLPGFLCTIGFQAFENILYVEELHIPSTVTEIGGGAFWGQMNLKSIVIPDGIKEIPSGCFECTGLEKVVLPEGLERIGTSAFSCGYYGVGRNHIPSRLSEIVIPDSVTHIEKFAFQGRENLEKVTMSKNLEFIGAETFADTAWLAEQNGLVYFNDSILYTYAGEIPEDTELALPNKTTYIADKAFKGQKNLKKVFIPDGVQLGLGVFQECKALTEVRLPADLTEIPSYAFSGTNLERVTIPQNVKVISTHAFAHCKNLKEVVFNEGLEFIDDSAFRRDSALTSVRFPSTLKGIGHIAFRDCGALTEIVFERTDGWADYVIGYENDVKVAVPQNSGVTPMEDVTLLTKGDAPNYFWFRGDADEAVKYLEYLT